MQRLDQASDDLAAIELARLRAIVAADGPALWSLHDPAFVLCDPGGSLWDRERYVGGLCDGSVSYTRFEPVSPIEVLRSADLAVVRYRSVIDLTTPHGGGHLECWHQDTYVRDATAGWRCRWSQATDTIRD
ncbi:nuclear transport factor 2 family protein [Intrasporangium sp. YIM S08009]|uniref:nuclear transport factor 2 family protein n=1 Tax=Intrasporangium zincisolvens TaxID=3080018 RepID=UPI002B05DF36|nr:nuclear transport factor 2 family protein [Intrasporangium sp. YIM S08009]